MKKLKVKTPFFVFNPKSYLFGEELIELAKVADEMARKHDVSIFVTVPFTDIDAVASVTDTIIVTSQHVEGISPGRGMGYAFAASVKNAGANATFLNHAEHSLTSSELVKSIEKSNELGIITIVCADSILEAEALAMLNPDIILCEPTELIGTGQTSDESYIIQTNEAIKRINPEILVMQAAGISTAEDVFRTISLGADGTGATSGIINAKNSKEMLTNMINAAVQANTKHGGE